MNNNLTTTTPQSGTAILPNTFGTNQIIHTTQQQSQQQQQQQPQLPPLHAFNSNSFIQLLPTQLNAGPILATNINLSNSPDGCNTKLLASSNTTNSGGVVVTSGAGGIGAGIDNRNCGTLTLMPQMAFITQQGVGVNTATIPTHIADLSSLQQPNLNNNVNTSSVGAGDVSPMISVITNTTNNMSNNNNPTTSNNQTLNQNQQHPAGSFLIPSGVAAAMGVTPINVILTSSPNNNNNGSTSTINTTQSMVMGCAAGGASGKHNVPTSLMEMKSNAVLPTSVLISNRPQYQLQQGNNNKPSTVTQTQRSSNIYTAQSSPFGGGTIFNPEMVKQIVVGNAIKNTVITHAPTRNTHIVASPSSSSSSQTLLKPTINISNVVTVKQQNMPMPNKSTPNLLSPSTTTTTTTEPSGMMASVTGPTNDAAATAIITQVTNKQSPHTNSLMQQQIANTTKPATATTQGITTAFIQPPTKFPLPETVKAVAVASVAASKTTKVTTAQQNSEHNEMTRITNEGKIVANPDISNVQPGEIIAPAMPKPPPHQTTSTKVVEPPPTPQPNVSVIKTVSILNQNNSVPSHSTKETDARIKESKTVSGENGSGQVIPDDRCDLTTPTLAHITAQTKQESLLKARTVQNLIDVNISPRSKQRSKSLNSTLKDVNAAANLKSLTKPTPATTISRATDEPTLAERRHSTAASEGKVLKQKTCPSSRKQSSPTTASKVSEISQKAYEIIDLIDYNEEEDVVYEDNEKVKREDKIKAEKTNIELLHKDAIKMVIEQDPKDIKPSTKNDIENELAVGSSIKIEILVEKPEKDEFKTENGKLAKIETRDTLEVSENDSVMFEDAMKTEDDVRQSSPTTAASSAAVEQHTQDSLEKLEKSLYCDEKISLSSTSTSSSRQSLHEDMPLMPPLLLPTTSSITHQSHQKQRLLSSTASTIKDDKSMQPSTSAAAAALAAAEASNAVSSSTVADSFSYTKQMLKNFNMLTWNQRIGSAQGTKMRFQLNEFNLIEINERCAPRTRVHTAYEKPIYERESVPNISEKRSGVLYLCRRCNCHGAAMDFLAPEFCSLDCLKRNSRKRRHEEYLTVTRKRKATHEPAAPTTISTQASNAGKRSFRWSTYLPERFKSIAAPVNLFINPFPTGPNRFQIGMKLEAIDPENCSLFCVCTIVDIQGFRLKLTFDGYDYMYDFWVNADSMDIFPPGWCAKTKRVLQPPKGKRDKDFNWPAYLEECNGIVAQRSLFTHLNASLGTHNPFKIGMHLEAEDLNDTGKLCVASVADVLDNRIRVHFDGWDDCYDYWVDISSPYIHPCGWHVGRQQLIVPPEFENTTFLWTSYIRNYGSGMAATEEMFSTRDPIEFKHNMKLEVVDPRNPCLIRPATIVGRKGHRIKLHLDCWASNYCFWLEDDSADLHPIGWCEATGHDLEPPPGYRMRSGKITCQTFGCRGIGNAKRLYLSTHTTRDCCPYAPDNWRQKGEKPPRLEHDEIVRAPAATLKHHEQHEQQNSKKASTQQQPQQQQQQQKQKQKQLNDILQQIQLLDNIKTRHHAMQQEKQQQQQQRSVERTQQLSNAATTKSQQRTTTSLRTDNHQQQQQADKTLSSSNPQQSNEESASLLLPQIKIAKEFLYDYGPRLQQNYKIWQRNVAFDMQRIKRNPLLWSTKDTCAFVQCVLRNADITASFLHEDIDGNALMLLQQSDLTDLLKIKLGPAVKLYSCILQLRTLTATKFDEKK